MQRLKYDLPASIVVFFVALPLCLGVALASGAPLFSGLLAGVIGGLVVGALSRSPLGVSGPAAGLTIIVLGAIQALGSFEAFLAALLLAGLMQIGFGLLRAGVLSYFFPSAVIHGMLAGIGLLIIFKELPYALGRELLDGSAPALGWWENLQASLHPGVLCISVLAGALLLLWERPAIAGSPYTRLLPGAVGAVLAAVLCQWWFAQFPTLALSPAQLVAVPVASSLSGFLALFAHPDFSQIGNPLLWQIALTIAIVASLETLLSVEAIDKLDPLKRNTPANRELFAQGIGNTLAGLLGGLPVTQVIVRSSVNLQAGAKSRLAAIVHGALLLACLALAPKLINLIPLGALATILILTGYKLAKPALFVRMWRLGMEQFLPFIVTVAGVLLTDLLLGVSLGLAVAIVMLLQRNYLNSYFLHLRERQSSGERHMVTMRLAEEVSFLNKGAIKKELNLIPDDSLVLIDQSHCRYMDHDIAEIINDFAGTAPGRGIVVQIIERDQPPPSPSRREDLSAA